MFPWNPSFGKIVWMNCSHPFRVERDVYEDVRGVLLVSYLLHAKQAFADVDPSDALPGKLMTAYTVMGWRCSKAAH